MEEGGLTHLMGACYDLTDQPFGCYRANPAPGPYCPNEFRSPARDQEGKYRAEGRKGQRRATAVDEAIGK